MLNCGCLVHHTVALSHHTDELERLGASPLSLEELVSRVWALDGSTMRAAARLSLESAIWDHDPVPIMGLATCIEADARLTQWRSNGRLSLDEIPADSVSADAIDAAILAAVTRPRAPRQDIDR